ncbi:MAG TPA: hypothetical protein PLU80_22925, partial [Acidobacteriota bacterium]|nr:hypothetical protein [Acidobacteriota bacterium]
KFFPGIFSNIFRLTCSVNWLLPKSDINQCLGWKPVKMTGATMTNNKMMKAQLVTCQLVTRYELGACEHIFPSPAFSAKKVSSASLRFLRANPS